MPDITELLERSDFPRRIVVSGEFWRGAMALGLAQGLRDSGCCVAEVDLFDFPIVSPNLIAKAVNRITSPIWLDTFNRRIISAVKKHRASVFVTTKGTGVSNKTIAELREQNVYTVNYYPDVMFDHNNTPALNDYNLIATTKHYHVSYLMKLVGPDRVMFLEHGYSSDVHRMIPGRVQDRYDIGYVGTGSRTKVEYLNAVARRFPNLRIAIGGCNWREHVAGTPIEPFILGHELVGDSYGAFVQSTRIMIGLHFAAASEGGWADSVSTRTFEIPAFGGFMLHADNPEVRQLYRVPDEIDVFSNAEDLCAKIEYYLHRPEVRAMMSARAHARCVPAYGLSARAADLLRKIDGTRAR